MLNRRLLEILQHLDVGEKKRFRLFLQSPYFTARLSHREILRLYDYLVQHEGDNPDALDKRSISKRLFPQKPFLEKAKNPIDTLASDLLRLARQFLYQQETEREVSEPRKLLPTARFYLKHGMPGRMEQIIRQLEDALRQAERQDERWFFESFEIADVLAQYKIHTSSPDDAGLDQLNDRLEYFFAIKKMQVAASKAFHHLTIGARGETPDDPYLPLFLGGRLKNNILIQAYSTLLELIETPDQPERLVAFEALLEQHRKAIPAREMRSLLAGLRAICLQALYKTSSMEYVEKIFEFTRRHLEQGYLGEGGKIPVQALNNLVTHGLRLGYFEAVEQILKEYTPDRIVGTQFPGEVYDLQYAQYYYAKGEYDLAVGQINRRTFENPNFGINVDLLLIKIYYDTRSELLDHRIQAMRQKIRRSVVPKAHKSRLQNLLTAVEYLRERDWAATKEKKAQLRKQILDIPELINRDWFLARLPG